MAVYTNADGDTFVDGDLQLNEGQVIKIGGVEQEFGGGGIETKIYRAILHDTGSGFTVDVLENTLGFVPTYTYDAGDEAYKFSSAALWTANKTMVRMGTGYSTGFYFAFPFSTSDIWVQTYNISGVPITGRLFNVALEIIVYP